MQSVSLAFVIAMDWHNNSITETKLSIKQLLLFLNQLNYV